jgi:hypothetical protein
MAEPHAVIGDAPGWLREEAQRIREAGGPPRGAEAVAVIIERCARLIEERSDLPEGQQANPRPGVLLVLPLPCEARLAMDLLGRVAEAWERDNPGKTMTVAHWEQREHTEFGKTLIVWDEPVNAEGPTTAPAEGDLRTGGEPHPEDSCHRCGRSLSIPWAAPSPLWNAVMRGGSINGDDLFDGIVCPTCFAQLAEERGIADLWRFDAQRVHVPLETVTPSGRVWDEQAWMWREPADGDVS